MSTLNQQRVLSIVHSGNKIGSWQGFDIPEYVVTHDGTRWNFDRCGSMEDTARMTKDYIARYPGMIFKRVISALTCSTAVNGLSSS